MKKFLAIILLVTTIVTLGVLSGCEQSKVDPTDDNYRVFYQVFVGSFSDSNDDGIGDLRGLINRMDYLNDGDITNGQSLGVQGLWLSPIFPSPTYHKYDTYNYYDVDSLFGTLDDLKELIALCHERNVKIILDLVLNHTSTSHPNFAKFKTAQLNDSVDDPYYDYYTYKNYRDDLIGNNAKHIVPGSTNIYYEGNFDSGMPELNYDNPQVRQDMLDVAKFYLDMGIDGFRFDAVKYIYYGDTAKSVDFWKWYMEELTKIKSDVYCVGECWSAEGETLQYVEALNCFNFQIGDAEGYISRAAKSQQEDVGTFANYVSSYQNKILSANANGMPISFLTNHDQDRSAGFLNLSNGQAFMAANLMLLAPGSPFIYYGEEIGMKGARGGANTDANRRLAMLWGDDDTVRNPFGATYESKYQINGTVASHLEDENSLLNRYRQLIELRVKYPQIARGSYKPLTTSNGCVAGFIVTYNGETTVIMHNSALESVTVDLSKAIADNGLSFKKILETVGNASSFSNGSLTIGAQTSVIIR